MKAFDLRFESTGTARIGGESVPYRTLSETMRLGGTPEQPEATLFSFTYLRSDVDKEEAKKRPVIFAFNGGPGSSCIWLHLGLMGPTRVKLEDPLNPNIAPPYLLEDNPHSPLPVADIVMIDPVGTGFARLLEESAAENYFGVDEDAAAVARFIEAWLTKHDRWQSPKYLLGESYGTLRCGVLTEALMGGPTTREGRVLGIAVDGIILMGSAMLNGMDAEKVEPSVLNLPSYAATRYFFRPEAGISGVEFVEQAYTFAREDYLPALFAGSGLDAEKRREIASKLAFFTGLPEDYFQNDTGLRIDTGDFITQVRREHNQDVGLYDSRYVVPHGKQLGVHDTIADDAAMGLYVPPFVGAMNGAKREELQIDTALPYNVITLKDINFKWNYKAARTSMQCLTAAMRRNKDMRILFATGRFDLVTTMGYARYVAGQSDLPPDRVTIREYDSGHMPYLGEESAAALSADLRAFVCAKGGAK